MLEVRVVVEGQTELAFVSRVILPCFAERLRICPILAGKSGQPGGAPRWEVAKRDLCRHLKSGGGTRVVYVTTMFDYYGMPTDWPGRGQASAKAHADKAPSVEAAMHRDVTAQLGDGFATHLFRPYVQIHELEALIFVDILDLKAQFPERNRQVDRLAEDTVGFAPEEINDSQATAPSHRIAMHIPEYERAKLRAAPAALASIGLPRLRAACPHFDSWVEWLESLAPTPPNQ